MRTIVDQYFTEHPEAKDEVMKAWHAFHVYHFCQHPQAHSYNGPWRDCECIWCGRSREQVRHDDLPATCTNRPPHREIADIIKGEEEKANLLLNKASIEVPKAIKAKGLSGETLFFLHGTHGWPIDVVELIIDIPPEVRQDYQNILELEAKKDAALTKSKQKVIVAYDKGRKVE